MYNVAVVGATGIVGRQIVEILDERDFPVKVLSLFASPDSLGEFLQFGDESMPVQLLEKTVFDAVDIAFFCAGATVSAEYCPVAAAAGVICIDCSGYWSDEEAMPLVVPEVNPEAVAGFKAKRIIANPDCATIQLSLPVQALGGVDVVERVVVSTYQAVSDCGQKGVDELRQQSGELLNGRPAKQKEFSHQVGFDCIPQIGDFLDDGYTSTEVNLVKQMHRLFDKTLAITATAVTVPIFYGNCQSVNIQTRASIDINEISELLDGFTGLEVVDDLTAKQYPLPVDVTGQDGVYVGRLRTDFSVQNGLNLWSALDNIRKGAATNAVQIA